jgi:hypothetical protein
MQKGGDLLPLESVQPPARVDWPMNGFWLPPARYTSTIYAFFSVGTVAGLAFTPFLAQQVGAGQDPGRRLASSQTALPTCGEDRVAFGARVNFDSACGRQIRSGYAAGRHLRSLLACAASYRAALVLRGLHAVRIAARTAVNQRIRVFFA